MALYPDLVQQDFWRPGQLLVTTLSDFLWIGIGLGPCLTVRECTGASDRERVQALEAAMTQLAAEPVVEHGTPIDDSLSACTSEADAKSLLIERSALKGRSMLPQSLWDSTHVSVFFLAATQNPISRTRYHF